VYSVVYALTGRSLLHKYPRFLQLLHTLWYSTVTTYPFVVTAVYWALTPRTTHGTPMRTGLRIWLNVSFHCLNTVFAFFETMFSGVGEQRWTHVIFILVLLILYIVMAYIIRLTAKFYVYEFMDWATFSSGATVGYICAVGSFGGFIFFVLQKVAWAKTLFGGVKRSAHDRDGGRRGVAVNDVEGKEPEDD
jgi:hypothetical protein